MSEAKCEICGEPMPQGEEMFKFHGYSGPCPKPPLPIEKKPDPIAACKAMAAALCGFTAQEIKARVAEINDAAFDEAQELLWAVVNGSKNHE